MLRKIEHTRTILRMLYESLFAILIISFLSLFFLKVQLGFAVMGITMLLFCVSYIIRSVSFNNIVVFGIHCVMLAGCYYLPYGMGVRILVAGVVIFLIRDALLFVARGGTVTPLVGAPWPTFLISFVIYLFSLYHGEAVFLAVAYFIPVLLIVLYYMMRYVEGLSNYYSSTKDTKEDIMRRLVSQNTLVIGMLLIIFFVGIYIGNVHLVQSVFEMLLPILSECLRIFILAMVFLLSKLIPSFTFSEEPIELQEGGVIKPVEDTSDTPFLWIAYLMVGVVLLWILYTLLKRFIRLLLLGRSLSEEGENITNPVTIEVETVKPAKRKHRSILVNDRARRYYRKCILKYKPVIPLRAWDTCRDIAKMIEEEHGVHVNQLTEYYAQIRYGREDSDSQPILEAMKRLGKKKT